MPAYEYECKKCGRTFNLVMSIREHDKAEVRCPKCKSKEVKHLIESFYVTTSKKS
jgi:putative FmdB family regulatory protein